MEWMSSWRRYRTQRLRRPPLLTANPDQFLTTDDERRAVVQGFRTPPGKYPRQRIATNMRMAFLERARRARCLDYCRRSDKEPEGLDEVHFNLSSVPLGEALALQRQGSQTSVSSDSGQSRRASFRADRLLDKAKEMESVEQLLKRGSRAVTSSLLIGPPGSGKTETCVKVLADWANRKAFRQFTHACYVDGADKRALRARTAPDLLRLAMDKFGAMPDDIGEMEHNDAQLLVILDGADEWGKEWKSYEGLRQLLARERFGNCSLIITSRPSSAVGDLAEVCQARYYLAGFSEQRLCDLIRHRLGPEQGQEVIRGLQTTPLSCVREMMMQTPLIANMICQLVMDQQMELIPLTKTELYKTMAANFVRRRAKKLGQDEQCSYDDTSLDGLAAFALRKYMEEQFLFDMDELKAKCGQEALEIGFLGDVVDGDSLERPEQLVRFTHLTWQEYLAAYAVARDPDPVAKIHEVVGKVGSREHTRGFWQFVAGQMDAQHLPVLMTMLRRRLTNRSPSSSLHSKSIQCWLLSCIAESCTISRTSRLHSRPIREAFSRVVNSTTLDLSYHICSVQDVNAIAMCLLYHKSATQQVVLKNCGLGAAHCRVFAQAIGNIRKLDLTGNAGLHNEEGLAILVDGDGSSSSGLATSACLQSLNIGQCRLNEDDSSALQRLLLRTHSLTTLVVEQNELNSMAVKVLCAGMQDGCPLRELDLQRNQIDHCAGCALGAASSRSALAILRLDNNKLGDIGVAEMINSLTHPQHLSGMNLSSNGLTGGVVEGVLTLLRNLRQSQQQQQLGVAKSSITDQVFSALQCATAYVSSTAQWMLVLLSKDKEKLKEYVISYGLNTPIIALSNNDLTWDDLERLARLQPKGCSANILWNLGVVSGGEVGQGDTDELFLEMAKFAKLKTLTIPGLGIGDEGARTIAARLAVDTRFQEVVVQRNLIQNDGARCLATMLRTNSTITSLDLSFNNITGPGLAELVLALTESNTSLQCLNLCENQQLFKSDDRNAADSISKLVRGCRHLDYLGLATTGFEDQAAMAVASALQDRSCLLRVLIVGDNRMSVDGVAALGDGIEKNSSVQLLSLAANGIGDDSAVALAASLQARDDFGCPLQCVWMGENPASPSVYHHSMINSRCWHSSATELLKLL